MINNVFTNKSLKIYFKNVILIIISDFTSKCLVIYFFTFTLTIK